MTGALLLVLAALSPLLAALVLILLVVSALLWRRVELLALEARHDPLTALPNRRGLARAWDRLGHPRALLFVDLIGFKGVNDRLGHAAGDALLVDVARRLAAAVPPPGVLARWGGDEFVAVVPGTRAAVQMALIENAAVMGHDLSAWGGSHRAHVGVTVVASEGAPTLTDAMAEASALLLEQRGRARSAPFNRGSRQLVLGWKP